MNIKSMNLKEIGKTCQCARLQAGKGQKDVAYSTGYTIGNVLGFECGKNNNLLIFLWYVQNTNLTIFGGNENE